MTRATSQHRTGTGASACRASALGSWTRSHTAAGEPLDAVVLDVGLRQGLVAVQQLGRAGLRVGTVECAATSAGAGLCLSLRECPRGRARPRGTTRRHGRRVARPDRAAGRARRHPDARRDHRGHQSRAAPISTDVARSPSRRRPRSARSSTRTRRCGRRRSLAFASRAVRQCNAGPTSQRRSPTIGLPAVVKPTRSWVVYGHRAHRLQPGRRGLARRGPGRGRRAPRRRRRRRDPRVDPGRSRSGELRVRAGPLLR